MNLTRGLARLLFVSLLTCFATLPVLASHSLFDETRGHVNAVANSYQWEQANLAPNQIAIPPDVLATQLVRLEMLVGGATLAMLMCLGLGSWVIAGFRQV